MRIMDLTAATTLANGDYFPFHPDGVEIDKRVSWANVKNALATAFIQTLLDDADAATARGTLGLGTMAVATEASYPLLTGVRAFTGAQTFNAGVVTGTVRPASDSTTAFQVQNAAGTENYLVMDTVAGVLTLGKMGAPDGSVLLKAKYDHTFAQTLFTEYSSGSIGLGQYMYQSGSATWLSGYAHGAYGRSAFIVGASGCKLMLAPSQDVAPGVALTTQPTVFFSADSSGVDVVGILSADGLRLDVTPTSETVTPTHTITISVNGTNYKVPCVAA